MAIEVGATQTAINTMIANSDDTMHTIVERVAETLRTQARINAPIGTPGNSTNPPGDLKAGMLIDGPTGAHGHYIAKVGPVVRSVRPGPGGSVFNYARIRELGGTIHPTVSTNLKFKIHGHWFQQPIVHQEGTHYLLRARLSRIPDIHAIIEEELTILVEGK